MYCGWRPIQRVFRLKRRKRALIGREQTTGSAGGSDSSTEVFYSMPVGTSVVFSSVEETSEDAFPSAFFKISAVSVSESR